MLRIQNATGQVLQLDDTDIEFELNNWLLADSDELPGSYSYPISFPLSDPNIKFLKHKHLPESRPEIVPVTVWVNGIMLRKSSLSYKIQKKQANGYLKVDAGELAAKIKGVYLYEIMGDEKVYLYDPVEGPDVNTIEQKQQIIRDRMKAMAMADPGTYPITFFPVENNAFGPSEIASAKGVNYKPQNVINSWFNDQFIIDSGLVYGRHVVPFLYLTYVLKRICTYFGYNPSGTFFNDPEVNSWVLYNTQTLYSANLILKTGLFADLRLHVPYFTVPEFLKALRDDFGLGIYFDSTTLEARFELYDAMITSTKTPTDLTPFVLSGYENEIPDEKGYSVISYEDSNDDLYKDKEPITSKIGDGQKEIKTKFGTLQMTRGRNPEWANDPNASTEWVIPKASQKGNLISGVFFGEKDYFNGAYKHKNEFGLRILSYRGMQPGTNGKLYPYGTSLSKDYNQKVIGKWSLDPAQKDSVYQKVTVPFYTFLANSRRIRYEMLIPISKAKSIRMDQVYSLKGENLSRIKFIIDQFTFAAPGKHGLLPAKLKVAILVSKDVATNIFTGEQFFVEMIISNERTVISGGREVWYQDLTIKVWADANKTIPGNPTDLTIKYIESITEGQTNTIHTYTFVMSGNEHFLPDMITYDSSQNYHIQYGFDYSDDYTIVY